MKFFQKLIAFQEALKNLDEQKTVEKIKALPAELKAEFADELKVLVAFGEFAETITRDGPDAKIETILTHLRP